MVSSFESQLHLLDSGLEFHKALLHRAAEVKQDNGALELLLHCLPLAAGQARERVDAVVDAPELAQTVRPSTRVLMVAEGREMAAFRLRICSSTLASLE